jgi:hypothetical protein
MEVQMYKFGRNTAVVVSIALVIALLPSCSAYTPKPVEKAATPTLETCTLTPVVESPTVSTPNASADKNPGATPPASSPDYTSKFVQVLGTTSDSCLPDRTKDDIGIYIYDLENDRELVSINADTPFQFASAFKGPVLVYFLSSCRKYWDTSSPEWNDYFRDKESARNIDWYTSDAYKRIIIDHISDVNNWDNIATFFANNTVQESGVAGIIDKRYFVLNQVYKMITKSSNPATADVLRFVYDNCQQEKQVVIDKSCGSPNAINAFNAWFDDFAQIRYAPGEKRRGLYQWDVILEKGPNGKDVETVLSTNGLKDNCATQTARLNCSEDGGATNVLTARDFFKFYYILYHLDDERVKNTAFNILKIDLAGPARGNLKYLGQRMQAETMSKNGYAFFEYDSIIADAGIINYRGTEVIVVTLSFNAQDSMKTLYGTYNSKGTATGSPGLIEGLIEANHNNN